jgi:Regulator of chromosome condensation (RCC1) repeat
VQVPHVSGVTAIAAFYSHSLALRTDGIVQAWGSNHGGELGNGATADSPYAVQVENLRGVKVAVGNSFSLAVGTSVAVAQLTVIKILEHPDYHRLRLFNLQVDGVTVRANVNGSSTTLPVSPGNHTVSETGGTGTVLGIFGRVIGGDCAADGTVNLAMGDHKTCTITNYDHVGGCTPPLPPMGGSICCEPGDGTEDCNPPACSSACLQW